MRSSAVTALADGLTRRTGRTRGEGYARFPPRVHPLTAMALMGFDCPMSAHEKDDTTMDHNPADGGQPHGTEQPRPEELEDDGGFDEGQRDGGIPGNAPDHDGVAR